MQKRTHLVFIATAAVLLLGFSVRAQNATSATTRPRPSRIALTTQQPPSESAGQRSRSSMSICQFNDGLEPACLKQRLDEAAEQVHSLGQKLDDLRVRVEALERLAAQLQSVGDPQEGKADGFDNLWSAIRNLSNRLKALEKQ
jgi:hypothetical protein